MKQKDITSSSFPDIILTDSFTDNQNGWEITDTVKEVAALTDQGYHLVNKDVDRWHHFSIFPKFVTLKNLFIQCRIEVNKGIGPGQFGIIWGFDKKLQRLNRFCLSSEGRGCTVMHFERNHRPVFHRFYDPFMKIDASQPILLEILERDGYWYFRINKKLVYITHQTHMADLGNGIGFYVDPGVSINVKKLKMSKRGINKAFSLN
jgi:hypothetical protein